MAETAKKKGEKAPKPEAKSPAAPKSPSRLRERYRREMVPALMKRFGFKNLFQVPRPVKVIINMGLGEAVGNVKVIDSAVGELATITGQRPVVTRAIQAPDRDAHRLQGDSPGGSDVRVLGPVSEYCSAEDPGLSGRVSSFF